MIEDRGSISIEAGEKVEIYCRKYSSIPLTVEFGATTKNEGKLKGHVELESFGLMLNQPNKKLKLNAYHKIEIGFWDTFFKILIKADCDMEVSVPKCSFPKNKKYFAFMILVMLFVLVLTVFT